MKHQDHFALLSLADVLSRAVAGLYAGLYAGLFASASIEALIDRLEGAK